MSCVLSGKYGNKALDEKIGCATGNGINFLTPQVQHPLENAGIEAVCFHISKGQLLWIIAALSGSRL